MKKLVVLVGPPGSGKSSLAKEVFGHFTYINQDSQGKDHLRLFEEALKREDNIVIDRMDFNRQQRDRYLNPAKAMGYETEITVLHQPYAVCLERCLKREGHETIKDEANARSALSLFFNKYERPDDSEADKVTRVWPEGGKPSAVIIDLDGTMCNIDHRLHFVRKPQGVKKDWKSFFEGLKDDKINEWCADLAKSMSGKHKIVYCSGRPDNHKKETLAWLAKHNLDQLNGSTGNILYMRPRGDQREDSIIKEILLDFEILTKFTPYFMIDDRARVVSMWRRRGYTVLHCADGDF